jgi:hypothetical protein
LGNFAPPLDVIASICKRLFFVEIEGDTVVRVPGLAQWDAVLGSNEKTLVNVLQAHGPVLGREAFLERCRERAMNESTFNRVASRSVILKMPVRDTYTLVGATIPATSDTIGRGSIEENSTITNHTSLPEGRIVMAWKLNSSIRRSGVLRVPEPVNTFVEGEYQLSTVTKLELGLIQIRQRACWDVRRLLHYACSEIDDTLVIVLSLRDHCATGILGDETVAARVMSGDFDLDAGTSGEQGKPVG